MSTLMPSIFTRRVVRKLTQATTNLYPADAGSIITNIGAVGSTTIVLRGTWAAGDEIDISNVVAGQTITITTTGSITVDIGVVNANQYFRLIATSTNTFISQLTTPSA